MAAWAEMVHPDQPEMLAAEAAEAAEAAGLSIWPQAISWRWEPIKPWVGRQDLVALGLELGLLG
jgi:hypothetical protein